MTSIEGNTVIEVPFWWDGSSDRYYILYSLFVSTPLLFSSTPHHYFFLGWHPHILFCSLAAAIQFQRPDLSFVRDDDCSFIPLNPPLTFFQSMLKEEERKKRRNS